MHWLIKFLILSSKLSTWWLLCNSPSIFFGLIWCFIKSVLFPKCFLLPCPISLLNAMICFSASLMSFSNLENFDVNARGLDWAILKVWLVDFLTCSLDILCWSKALSISTSYSFATHLTSFFYFSNATFLTSFDCHPWHISRMTLTGVEYGNSACLYLFYQIQNFPILQRGGSVKGLIPKIESQHQGMTVL